jgi:hypothetical protein
VDALLPYVTRGLPNETLSRSDLHLELRVEPIRKNYGPLLQQGAELGMPFLLRELSFDDPAFDRALANAFRGVAGELVALVDDLDELTLDVELSEGTQNLNVTFAAQLRGTKSWTAQGIADAQRRASLPPDEFWALPATVPAASYSSGANPDRAQPIRDATVPLLDSLLAHGKLPASLRSDVRYLVENTGTSKAMRLGVQGPVPAPPKGKAMGDGELAEILSNLERQWGWQAVGYVNEPASGFVRYFDTWVKVLNDPAIKTLLKERLPSLEAGQIPSIRSKNLYSPGLTGSKQYEVVLPLKALTDGATEDGKLVIVVMPQGKNTWIGSSLDEKILLTELAKLNRPERTLGEREGLDALRGKELSAGGFFTTRHLLESILTGTLDMKPADVNRVFAVMPHHGETPVINTMRSSTSNGPRFELAMSAPKDVVQDLAAAVPALMANSLLSGF